MDLQALLTLVGIGTAGFFGGRLFMRVDTKREDVRREAIRCSQWCSANHLPLLNNLLESFAVNDLTGMIAAIRQVSTTLGDQDASQAVLDNFLKYQLVKQVETPEGREKLADFIAKRFGLVLDFEQLKPVVKVDTTHTVQSEVEASMPS